MIKRIKNKYVRRAVWLFAIGPMTVASVALGAIVGATEYTKDNFDAAGRAW
jgi:hypothetical protein